MNYLRRRATPWVSITVLVGGFVSAIILFWIAKIDATLHVTITNID